MYRCVYIYGCSKQTLSLAYALGLRLFTVMHKSLALYYILNVCQRKLAKDI